jgi:hypothetical protein
MQTKHAEVVTEALIEMLTLMKKLTHTISENDKGFAYISKYTHNRH